MKFFTTRDGGWWHDSQITFTVSKAGERSVRSALASCGRQRAEVDVSFDEEHLDDHYLCQREVAERDARIAQLEAALQGIYPAAREILWCSLVWNDHIFDYKALLQKADKAAKLLGFERLRGDPIAAANKWMERIDAALAGSTLDQGGEHEAD